MARADRAALYCSRQCSNSRVGSGAQAPNWKGGRKQHVKGYVFVHKPGHPRISKQAGRSGYVFEHILVAEAALGKFLPPGAVIHHVNGVKSDNRPSNLVICENQSYHLLLHARAKARVGAIQS